MESEWVGLERGLRLKRVLEQMLEQMLERVLDERCE